MFLDDNFFNTKNMQVFMQKNKKPLKVVFLSRIAPESLSMFYDVITSSSLYKKSAELNELASKIIQVKEENMYMIHFGVKSFYFLA
jgi:hypothetical protein